MAKKTYTKAEFVKLRMAEGFSEADAIKMYEGKADPSITQAQEQKVPTRGEMIQMIHEAMTNNPNKKKLYTPDFSLCKEYLDLREEIKKAEKSGDYEKAQELNAQALNIKIGGTVTDEERQAEIDKTLEMPIASIIKERKKYEAIISQCEEDLDTFDISGVQAQVDALEAQYKEKASKARSDSARATLYSDYEKAVEDLEQKLITIPMNEIALKRYRAKEFYLIYEARVRYYVTANQDLIRAEMENAKREEIRGSLVDLAEALERADAKKAALGLEG